MAGRARLRPSAEGSEPATPLAPGEPVVSSSRVGAVLDVYPHLLETFLAFGFKPLRHAVLRRTVARHVTVARACRLLAVDERRLLDALNRGRERLAGGRVSLPLVSVESVAGPPPGCEDFNTNPSANPSEVYP
jgi:hypothetical protein